MNRFRQIIQTRGTSSHFFHSSISFTKSLNR
jgi:hypothetical protein